MNDFQIISKLGEGAYSTVYKVKRLVDGNIYALKKVKLLNLSEKEKSNALNEVRILASIKSHFVISYKEAFFDEKDSTLGIVMEYADRGDLYQKIVEHKKSAMFFEESDIWRIFIQLVKGLKALHDLKILHRDLKSANVFLLSDGSAKLGDLNVSKVARRGLGYTQTGTPYYASPEVWKDQPYNNKSDIWSLGCVLYEMITLRPPFRAQNMEGLYNKVIKGQFNKIPDRFSNDLFEVIKLLLQIIPDARPSCDQILKNPIIQKRIEYFKSFAGDEQNEDKALLQTIHIPKNLLFLSDKLPKPNYGNIKTTNPEPNSKNYKSFMGKRELELKQIENIKNSGVNNGSLSRPKYLAPLGKIVEKGYVKESGSRANSPKRKNDMNDRCGSLSNGQINKIDLKISSPDLPGLNIISRKKLEISNLLNVPQKRKIIINSNSSGKNLNNNYKLNEIYKMYVPHLNRHADQRYNKLKNDRNKYYNMNYNYVKNLEKYYDNIHKLNYNYNLKSSDNSNRNQGPELKLAPKIKLSPLKRNINL